MDHDYSSLKSAIRFLADLQQKTQTFQNLTASTVYIEGLLSVLSSVIQSFDPISSEAELDLRTSIMATSASVTNSSLHIQPSAFISLPTVSTKQGAHPQQQQRPQAVERHSSYVIITSHQTQLAFAHDEHLASSGRRLGLGSVSQILPPAQLLAEVVMENFLHQIFENKEFSGFHIHASAPPCRTDALGTVESYLLESIVIRVHARILVNQDVLCEPRLISNVSSLISLFGEAICQGWFRGNVEALLDLVGMTIEYLQRPGVASNRNVRLCGQAISTIKVTFLEVILLQLMGHQNLPDDKKGAISVLNKMLYWQQVIFVAEEIMPEFSILIWYVLHRKLVDSAREVKQLVAAFWRIMLVQKPAGIERVLEHAVNSTEKDLLSGFEQLKEMNDDAFLFWIEEHTNSLEIVFSNSLSMSWDNFTLSQRKKAQAISKIREDQRGEMLNQWALDDTKSARTIYQHEQACHYMMANIYSAERLKHQRNIQDQQDTFQFLLTTFRRLELNLKGPCDFFGRQPDTKWRLDLTEGRNRMRIKMVPDIVKMNHTDEPREAQRQSELNKRPPADSKNTSSASELTTEGRARNLKGPESVLTAGITPKDEEAHVAKLSGLATGIDDDFEIVDDPREDDDGFEDKNRTVIRTLQRGDQIQLIYNVSRVIGLEAWEGLLVLGKVSLYLLDDFFQRSDGEIVSVSQAPKDERDPYVEIISGRPSDKAGSSKPAIQRDSRQWKLADVVSISKRRFLFRDVAIEMFFTNGRSCLLTSISPEARNELYLKLTDNAPHSRGNITSSLSEDMWRLETLAGPEDYAHSLGSKIAQAFQPSYPYPATRMWARGEISNFRYLMLVNTMAGRTFNDLTQYPVFPWVLADYTSDQLDLTKASTFRDFSRPMGAQTRKREAEFIKRYRTFVDLDDHSTPPFHYGTHYSSAMIVTSYLVRLQPFVQSFLLLQGGNFDHPDRMFHSIEQAWTSASQEHMADVRELIPEFFYLPEFLENLNNYSFGVLQKNGKSIDSVTLPPWAKGDPKIFLTKHREALESPYVRRNLPQWIDLVFGYKQQGEAAVKATNVFHHLSYHGAKDLDRIEDPVERVAAIGIIHNFGQTPHQVFQKPHPQQDIAHRKNERLDRAAGNLTRLPLPLLGELGWSRGQTRSYANIFNSETGERVTSLLYSAKQERLLCSTAWRLNMAPEYEKYMEWGFVDDGVRFYQADSRKVRMYHRTIGTLDATPR